MADEQRFTPGPWKVQTCRGCGEFEIHANQDVDAYYGDGVIDENSILECHFVSGSYSGAVRREEDARLIAQAPEMVAMLERTRPFIKTVSHSDSGAYADNDPTLYEDLKALIAKI